jgi:hypothetical protein
MPVTGMATVSERSPRTPLGLYRAIGFHLAIGRTKEASAVGGGAFTSRGWLKGFFLLNSGQAPDPGRRGATKHSETCQGAMLQEKSGGARDSAAWKKPEAV